MVYHMRLKLDAKGRVMWTMPVNGGRFHVLLNDGHVLCNSKLEVYSMCGIPDGQEEAGYCKHCRKILDQMCYVCKGTGVFEGNECFLCHGTGKFNKLDFTCGKCVSEKDCPYAFDPYNTNGDCLAVK